MPLATLASLISTVASHAVPVAGHAAEAKGASAKPAQKGKAHSETDKSANGFAAYLAAATVQPAPAAAPTPIVAKEVASSVGVQKTPVQSQNVPLPAPTSSSLTPAKPPAVASKQAASLATRAAPNAATAPSSPAGLEGMTAARKSRFGSSAKKTSASAVANAPAKPLSREGKNEAHLGIHAPVESPQLDAPTTSLLSSKTSESLVPQASQPVAAPPEPEAKPTPPLQAVSHATAEPSPPLEPMTSSASGSGTMSGSANDLVKHLAVPPAVKAFPTTADRPATTAPTHPSHADSHSSASSPLSEVLANNLAPPVQNLAPSHPTAPSSSTPVVDQLTRAVAANVEVVQRNGQTNVHLHLDPPQLGSVQIHLTATEHSVSARIVVAQEGTRQLLQDQAQHLRQSLSQAGVSLGSFDVARDGGGGSRGGNPQAPPQPARFASAPTAPPRVSTAPAVSRSTEGIDLIA